MKQRPHARPQSARMTLVIAVLLGCASAAAAGVTGSAPQQELQVVATGSGYGEVISTPFGISCYMPRPGVNYFVAPDCSESFASPQQVSLTAQADFDSVFVGWSGACYGRSPSCTLALAAHSTTAVVALFMRTRAAADCVLDWAETAFPSHLAPRAPGTQSVYPYYLRHYSTTGNYLGVHEGDQHVYFLQSGQSMLDLGSIADLGAMAGCK